MFVTLTSAVWHTSIHEKAGIDLNNSPVSKNGLPMQLFAHVLCASVKSSINSQHGEEEHKLQRHIRYFQNKSTDFTISKNADKMSEMCRRVYCRLTSHR